MKRIALVRTIKIIIVLLIILNALVTQAQDGPKRIKRDYFGFAASLGTRSSVLTSNYSAINNMELQQQGGGIGILWGGKAFQTRLSGGYYTSTDKVAHTTDLVQADLSANLYPLYIILKRSFIIEPYFTAGIGKNYYKLYGFYTNEQSNMNNNYSVTLEPYLGNLNAYNAVVGAGIEINLLDEYEFCKLFVDAKYNSPISEKSSSVFSQTSASAQLNINVGIVFGTNRFYKAKYFYGR